MIRRLIAIWQSDHTTVILSGLTIALGMASIQKVVEARTEQLERVNKELAARRTELAALEIPLSPAPAGSYPAREDLDPMQAGAEDERG